MCVCVCDRLQLFVNKGNLKPYFYMSVDCRSEYKFYAKISKNVSFIHLFLA